MAKQNFLSGGYYGKLGMTVGQRWKNIRTIRSYVIPHNPRTPAQQANRGQFGDCVFFAQVGMQLNYKAPCFEATDKTAWNYRMSVARGLQDLGLTELERFPLYPLNFSVPYQITSANVTEVVDETHIKVSVVGNLPEAERVLTMLLLLPGSDDWKDRLAVCVGQNSSEDYSSFTFQLPDEIVLSDGMQCRFISCDDKDSTTDLIASSQIALDYIPIDTHEFDTTFISLTRSGSTFTLTLNEPYQNGTNTVTITGLRAIVNGAQTNVTPPEATLINNGGKFAVVFTCPETENQNLWAFPSGCAIRFGEISSISSAVHATAENKTIAISNDDLSRTYDNRIASVSRSGATFTLTYATTAPTSTSGSGTVTVHAVSKGSFIDYVPDSYHATKDSVTFTQSYTDESEILAFPSGSTAFANLTRIGNGVTYTPYYTSGNAVSNTDLSRSYNNTVASVSRSGGTFTFAFEEALPSFTSQSGSVSIRAVSKGAWATYSPSSVTIGSQNFSFAQSYTDESEIYAFPSGATVTPNLTLVGNGVTYAPRNTAAQSISNTDLSRSYNNTVASVSRSGGVFTFAFEEALPSFTSHFGSIFIRAVSKGKWVEYSPSSVTVGSQNFSFTQSYTDESEIYAFPSGATVGPILSIVGNGVTYTPRNNRAQSVSNTSDLSRTLSDSPSWSTSDNAFIITLPDNATISSASGSVSTTTKNHNQIFQKSEISTLTCGYSSNKIKITSATFDSNTILLSDDSFTLPAGLSVVANGVTYNVAAQTVAVTKTGSQQLLSSLFAISAEYSVIIATFYFILNSSSYSPASHPSSLYLTSPFSHLISALHVAERGSRHKDTNCLRGIYCSHIPKSNLQAPLRSYRKRLVCKARWLEIF